MSEAGIKQPEETCRLFGHEAAEAFLATAWRSGKLAHGWLLCGDEGIGKATLAFRFARGILSGSLDTHENPLFSGIDHPAGLPDGDPDDPVSRKIAGGAHPNVQVLRRSVNPKTGKMRGEIVVDDVRAATRILHATAMDGGWRILIVDPVDDLNINAANALLKSLEEPPDKCLFLLINHRPGAVLPTIRSRCQALFLSSLGDTDVRHAVTEAAPDLAEQADDNVWDLAEGSPGRALRLLDAAAADLERRVSSILEGSEDKCRIDALDLAESVTRSGALDSYHIVGELLGRRLAVVAREASEARVGHDAATLWAEIGDRFRRAEALNLDRRHVVFQAALNTRELLRRHSAA